MGRPPVPAIAVLPEGAESFLEGPGATNLEILALQSAERRALLIGHVFRPAQPQVLGAGEPLVPRALEGAVFPAADVIDGVMQMLDDVELVEHDLGVRARQMRPRGLHVGLPHVHGDGPDAVTLGGRQGGPEPVQTLLLAIIRQVEHVALLQVSHDRQVAMPLRDGFLIDPQADDHLGPAPSQPSLDGPRLDPPALLPTDPQQPHGARDRTDRVLLGSDFPVKTPLECVTLFKKMNDWGDGVRLSLIPEQLIDDIIYRRPFALFGW